MTDFFRTRYSRGDPDEIQPDLSSALPARSASKVTPLLHQPARIHLAARLCDQIRDGVVIEQPLEHYAARRIHWLEILLGTHHGKARGLLNAEIVSLDGRVLAFNSYIVQRCHDNGPIRFVIPPEVDPGEHFQLRLTCHLYGDAPFCAIYLQPAHEHDQQPFYISGLVNDHFALRVLKRLTSEKSDLTVPGFIDFVSGQEVTGWLSNVERDLDWRLTTDAAGRGDSIAFGYRPNVLSNDHAASHTGFRGHVACPPPPTLIDDRTICLTARRQDVSYIGAPLSHPARRRMLNAAPLTTYLEANAVVPLQPASELQLLIRRRKKLAIFAIFHERHKLFEHQLRIVDTLRRLGFVTVLVNSSLNVDTDTVAQMQAAADSVILRDGPGLDFASWLTAIAYVGPALTHVTEMVLANDSCFGPFFDLGPFFNDMRRRDIDVWGFTDSWERMYHLQSFFLVFSQKALQSRGFFDWANAYSFSDDRLTIIQEGEIGLSRSLIGAGLSLEPVFRYEDVAKQWVNDTRPIIETLYSDQRVSSREASLDEIQLVWERLQAGMPLNPMSWFAPQLIRDFGCPFVKREMFVRDTRPHRFSNMMSVWALIGQLAPDAIEMIRDCAKSQSTGIVSPIGVTTDGSK